MPDIKTAIKTSGLPVPPMIKRIWTHIKDHPNITSSAIESVFSTPCSPRLHELEKRKMITSYKEKRRCGIMMKDVKIYRTCIPEYELLPLPAKEKKIKETLVEKVAIPQVEAPKKFDIKALSLGEAHEIYLELREFFK